MSDVSILLIDDEVQFLDALGDRLVARGFEVVKAPSGEIAVGVAAKRSFDAILLDMAMPGMDGLETLRLLLEADPDSQIILLTGRATLAQAVEAMKRGALDLMEKPADIENVVGRVAVAAERRASLRDRRIAQKIDDILRKKGW